MNMVLIVLGLRVVGFSRGLAIVNENTFFFEVVDGVVIDVVVVDVVVVCFTVVEE